MRQNAVSMALGTRFLFALAGTALTVAACSGSGFDGAVPANAEGDDAGATPNVDAATTGDTATPLTCKGTRADCNGRADDGCEVDTKSSPKNCGACGKACAKGEVCSGGKCSDACPATQTNCGGACVDTDSDIDHCSACNSACTAPANGIATCAAAKCSTQCNAGFESCTTGCCEKPPSPPVQPGSTVAAGGNHSCAITTQGALKCWGSNGSGKLGDNTQVDRKSAVAVSGLGTGVLAVGAGNTHTCALLTAGEVRCWGGNASGQLGSGDNTLSKVPKTVTGLSSGAIAVGVGRDHSCAVITGGAVKCWGSNDHGQLGSGTKDPTLVPVDVKGLARPAVALGIGSSYSCALLDDASVACWGANEEQQLGDGTNVDRESATAAVNMPSGITSIAAGVSHTCVLASGKVHCWGDNGSGQLGDSTTNDSAAPVEVKNLVDVVQFDTGTFHTCAIDTAGATKCWGEGNSGQLGDGNTNASASVVTSSLNGVAIKEVAGGSAHTCVRTQGENIKCWGSNSRGQLGNNSTSPSAVPVNVQAF